MPNSLCLHYILRFGDGRFLAILRHGGMTYEKLKVSVSCEEQLAEADLAAMPAERTGHWLRRTLLEEIFPGRRLQVESEAGRLWAERVEWARYLSIIYEEHFCNFALVCFVQLNIDTQTYSELYRAGLLAAGKADFEGNRYWFDKHGLRVFFATGRLLLTPFKNSHRPLVATVDSGVDPEQGVYELHGSSIYRLFLAGKVAEVL